MNRLQLELTTLIIHHCVGSMQIFLKIWALTLIISPHSTSRAAIALLRSTHIQHNMHKYWVIDSCHLWPAALRHLFIVLPGSALSAARSTANALYILNTCCSFYFESAPRTACFCILHVAARARAAYLCERRMPAMCVRRWMVPRCHRQVTCTYTHTIRREMWNVLVFCDAWLNNMWVRFCVV